MGNSLAAYVDPIFLSLFYFCFSFHYRVRYNRFLFPHNSCIYSCIFSPPKTPKLGPLLHMSTKFEGSEECTTQGVTLVQTARFESTRLEINNSLNQRYIASWIPGCIGITFTIKLLDNLVTLFCDLRTFYTITTSLKPGLFSCLTNFL